MKTALAALSLALALAALGLYRQVRRYLRLHSQEELEPHAAWLMGRMRAIAGLTIAASLLRLLRLFL